MSNEVEQKFHQSRVAFMIIDGEIMYLRDSGMSHLEWYISLGFPVEKFDDIVRGYYKNGRVIFYKGDFLCDESVIEYAKYYGNYIREEVGDADALVFAGVKKGKVGEAWDPIVKIELNSRKK